jgi:hypothetical protein
MGRSEHQYEDKNEKSMLLPANLEHRTPNAELGTDGFQPVERQARTSIV